MLANATAARDPLELFECFWIAASRSYGCHRRPSSGYSLRGTRGDDDTNDGVDDRADGNDGRLAVDLVLGPAREARVIALIESEGIRTRHMLRIKVQMDTDYTSVSSVCTTKNTYCRRACC